jgi:hypothetical protein
MSEQPSQKTKDVISIRSLYYHETPNITMDWGGEVYYLEVSRVDQERNYSLKMYDSNKQRDLSVIYNQREEAGVSKNLGQNYMGGTGWGEGYKTPIRKLYEVGIDERNFVVEKGNPEIIWIAQYDRGDHKGLDIGKWSISQDRIDYIYDKLGDELCLAAYAEICADLSLRILKQRWAINNPTVKNMNNIEMIIQQMQTRDEFVTRDHFEHTKKELDISMKIAREIMKGILGEKDNRTVENSSDFDDIKRQEFIKYLIIHNISESILDYELVQNINDIEIHKKIKFFQLLLIGEYQIDSGSVEFDTFDDQR